MGSVGYDLVISTIPLELDGVDVPLVHPYLTKEDAAKIRAYLDERMQRCTRENLESRWQKVRRRNGG